MLKKELCVTYKTNTYVMFWLPGFWALFWILSSENLIQAPCGLSVNLVFSCELCRGFHPISMTVCCTHSRNTIKDTWSGIFPAK